MKALVLFVIVASVSISLAPTAAADGEPVVPPGGSTPGPYPCLVIDWDAPGVGVRENCWGFED